MSDTENTTNTIMRTYVIDTFSYNGEPILELRLKYMFPYVDYFYIIESWYTHSGIKKPYLFTERHRHILEPYISKIKLLIIDEFPEKPTDWPMLSFMNQGSHDSWFRETYQRNYARDIILRDMGDNNSILVVGDVDEIPNSDVLAALPKRYFELGKPVALEMDFFYYNFSWRKKFNWYHTYVINDIGLSKTKETLSDMRTKSCKVVWRNAGWHCSYFLNSMQLAKKLESFAHRECDTPHVKTTEYVRECFQKGKDISGRGEAEDLVYMPSSYIESLPKEHKQFHAMIMFMQEYCG